MWASAPSVAAAPAALLGSDALLLETAAGQQEQSCGVQATTQGALQIQSKSEPNALSTIKSTGMNDNFSKSLCHYWFSFIGSVQPDLMWEWAGKATSNNLQNLPAVERAEQMPDFDQRVSLYDWSIREF